MSIASEINRLKTAKSDIKTAIENKGVTVPVSAKVSTYNTYISAIPGASEVINVSINAADTGTVTLYDNDAGETLATQNFSSVTSFSFSVLGGTNYTISISGSKAYSPSSYTYVAQANSVRNVSWTSIDLGVYIKYTDGSLSVYNSLSSGKTPVGVAVITSNTAFVLNYNTHPGNPVWSSGGQVVIANCYTTTNTNSAKMDFDGKANTDAIIAQIGTDAIAAYWAKNTCVYADGSIGWLPSGGEYIEIINNLSNINTALTTIGANRILTSSYDYYWTSTQYNYGNAWYAYGNGTGGSLSYQNKTYNSKVISVTSL